MQSELQPPDQAAIRLPCRPDKPDWTSWSDHLEEIASGGVVLLVFLGADREPEEILRRIETEALPAYYAVAFSAFATMEEAGKIHSEYTPRGWMKTEKELLIFEQHLYLRQPGYGTSYITGKYLFENALAEYSRINEKDPNSNLKNFFKNLIDLGNIPMTLFHWELNNDPSILNDIIPRIDD